MSRSYRKTPKCGWTTADSDKKSKQHANRKFRKINKQILAKDPEADLKLIREVSNVYDFRKDGKQYLGKYPIKGGYSRWGITISLEDLQESWKKIMRK